MKLFSLHRIVTVALILFGVLGVKAQLEYVEKAQTFLETKQLDSAKFYIDKAAKNPETVNTVETWLTRGFVYKSLYSTIDKGKNPMSELRSESFNSLKKAIMLDDKKEYQDNIVEGFQFLLSTLNNDVVKNLELQECDNAISLFRKYQEYYKIIDPSQAAAQDREIQFGLSLGSVYNEMTDGSTDSATASKYRKLAISVFTKVLSLDANNVSANYNLGILYYNQAVKLIKEQDYVDLGEIDALTERSSKLFKTSLPYMEKAHTLDPKREDALSGLAGIYWSLYDYDKANIYRGQLKKLQKGK